MARTPRLFIENACYHINTRGNRKQPVFKEDTDYRTYLHILIKAKKKYSIRLYAYCLMPNHVHLLADPDVQRDLSAFMHWLNRGYCAYFNMKYKIVGHLWQGRFKSKPIVKDQYLINCADYIEENPVRAQLVSCAAQYIWSSYVERYLSFNKELVDELRK